MCVFCWWLCGLRIAYTMILVITLLYPTYDFFLFGVWGVGVSG